MKINSVKVNSHTGIYIVTFKGGTITEYTNKDIPEEVIQFIQNRYKNTDSISSAVKIYH